MTFRGVRSLFVASYRMETHGQDTMSIITYVDLEIITLDYGELNGSLQEFLREFGMPSGDIDDEVLAEKNGGVQIITDRRKSCPNSYGVSESNTTIMDMLLSYHWFNSQQIRNTVNDIEP